MKREHEQLDEYAYRMTLGDPVDPERTLAARELLAFIMDVPATSTHGRKELSSRNERILADVALGAMYTEAALDADLSRERVRQIYGTSTVFNPAPSQ